MNVIRHLSNTKRARSAMPGRGRGRASNRALAVVGAGFLAAALLPLPWSVTAATQPAPVEVVGDPSACAPFDDLGEPVRLTRNGELIIPPQNIAWTLPDNPTWRENPFGNKSWVIRYQSMRYIHSLYDDWCENGDDSALNRAEFLIRDWYRDNPVGAAAPLAWYDHPVAWRAIAFVRGARLMPGVTWLREAIKFHGQFLVDHYGGVGNHAMNENLGLLTVSCHLGRADWIGLAAQRIDSLLYRSIDSQGVTNEQSVGYQEYNYLLYTRARRMLLDCGQPEPARFNRVRLMTNMLAHATLPNGEYEMLGNTKRKSGISIPDTWTEFTSSAGASGSPPPSTVAIYNAGFAFARTGWGETQPYEDEVMLTLRHGPGRALHGHDDGGSITLYGYGSRLLLDPGKNSWHNKTGTWPVWVASRAAHNVVTVDGLAFARSRTSLSSAVGASYAVFQTSNSGYSGVTNKRSVLFSRTGGYVIVDDRLSSSVSRTYRQLWHLHEDADPVVSGNRVRTRGPEGNLEIVQLLGGHTTRVLTGSTRPRQGWVTYSYQSVIPAPTVEHIRTGTSVRYITLLVPSDEGATITARVVQRWSDGYQVEVVIDGRPELVTVRGTTVTVVDGSGGDGGGVGPIPTGNPTGSTIISLAARRPWTSCLPI